MQVVEQVQALPTVRAAAQQAEEGAVAELAVPHRQPMQTRA